MLEVEKYFEKRVRVFCSLSFFREITLQILVEFVEVNVYFSEDTFLKNVKSVKIDTFNC